MTNLPLTEKQQYWLKHCRDYESFSGSQKAYAKNHQLKVTDLYAWRKILREKGLIKPITKKEAGVKAPQFSRIQLESPPRVSEVVQLRTQQVSINLQHLPEPQWLAEFITALESHQ